MQRETVGEVAGRRIIVMDSISYIGADEEGEIVISGSHGGTAAARYALAHPPFLAVFNDAGVGKEEAGIAALALLEDASIAAVTVDHTSARIGDGADTWVHGVISHLNAPAGTLGLVVGQMMLQDAVYSISEI